MTAITAKAGFKWCLSTANLAGDQMVTTYIGALNRCETGSSARRALSLVIVSSLMLWICLAMLLFVVLQFVG